MTRWLAVVSAALAVGLSMGVALFASSDADALEASPPRFERLTDLVPPHPGTLFFPLGREMHLDARAREMGWALTDDPPRKVADRYEAIWNSQGLDVRRHTAPDEEWVIAHIDGESEVRSVVVARSPGGQTSILASVSDEAVETSERVPRPAGCDLISSTGAVDQGVQTEMALLDCALGIDEVLRFYEAEVPDAAKTVHVDRPGMVRDSHVTLRTPTVELGLAMTQPQKAPPRSAVSVTLQRRGAR